MFVKYIDEESVVENTLVFHRYVLFYSLFRAVGTFVVLSS